MKYKKRMKKISIFIIAIMGLIVFCIWQNNDIVITDYEYKNTKIPPEFNNYKILHISDLHNKEFGKDQSRLIKYTKEISPDIIVITGDLIDCSHSNIEVSLDYIREAVKISPIYFVSGNHEKSSGVYESLSEKLESYGVIILDNKNLTLQQNDSSINLIGLSDITFMDSNETLVSESLHELVDNHSFNLLLSHRPEFMDVYTDNQVDLALVGHAHGGQVRLPFVGGLIAPNQGLFPAYTSGIHYNENTSMIISRGLGNSILPLRIFNRPELVVITLKNS
ncbi:metallophosphoesterase [Mycoplasmatota bacterium]|nr:metallophosphoesterase [Mycoplasmatota bacterium]